MKRTNRDTPAVVRQAQRLLVVVQEIAPQPDPRNLLEMAGHLSKQLLMAAIMAESVEELAKRERIPAENLERFGKLLGLEFKQR